MRFIDLTATTSLRCRSVADDNMSEWSARYLATCAADGQQNLGIGLGPREANKANSLPDFSAGMLVKAYLLFVACMVEVLHDINPRMKRLWLNMSVKFRKFSE